ncbi:MAG: NAD(P)/FAD-dependent oxidoreductase [Treponema sp.]|nr:NAD(P)/FAD-dependent oxidoreductase [Treponema sp.]
MKQKKLIIIGAGISGLVAGVYAQRSGFDVTILEQHRIPGGLSTSWSRKGYFFEGGMHWLTGSAPSFPLYAVWKETGALQKNNPIYNRDPVYTLFDGTVRLSLYRDLARFKQELLRVAPEDKKAIFRLCRDIKLFTKVHVIISDIAFLKTAQPVHPALSELLGMVPAGFRYMRLKAQTMQSYVEAFKNENIRALLLSLIGSRYNALSLVYSISSFLSGDCGFPEGGSMRMAQNLADTFTALGGTIRYGTQVQRIQIENRTVCGVVTTAGSIATDNVLVAFDTRTAIEGQLLPALKERWVHDMRRFVVTEQNMFFCLGVTADLSAYPETMMVPLKQPLAVGGEQFSILRINNYAAKKGYAPEGCSTVTCILMAPCYQFWKNLKTNGTYQSEKQNAIAKFIQTLETVIPEIRGNVAVTDLATPCTYERYTSSYEGSWMSVWVPGGAYWKFPVKSKTVRGLYFASERTLMPGGLPMCAQAGRMAAQTICRDNHATFIRA